jgi:methionine-gamma-lyase
MDLALTYAERLRHRADAIATTCVHAAASDEAGMDAPLVMSSAFAFASADAAASAFRGEQEAWIYGRWGNPTVAALERALAALEGAEDACATASGMSAIFGVLLAHCVTGDHIVAPRSMYAESARLLRERLPKYGIDATFVDATPAAYAEALRERTRILYVETPSNPTLALTDIRAISEIAANLPANRRPLVVVDGTFATPFSQTPLALGADVVVHSLTKGINGHGDVIGGAVLGSREVVARSRDLVVKGLGAVLSPMSAWLVVRGLATFALRQEGACATAAALATRLASHANVRAVHHPSLPSHAQHELATRQMHAYGSLLSFEICGEDTLNRGRALLEGLRVATHAVSLGDVRTLVVHPASTTHSTMPREIREQAGIGDGLLRVSCGLESERELISDFERLLG